MTSVLVFKNGTWVTVSMPTWVDPSWGEQERAAFATSYLAFKRRGVSDDDSFKKAEESVYLLVSRLEVSGKQHRGPENKKE